MPSKKTIVLGASSNPERYAYLAVKQLQHHHHHHEVIALGIKPGNIDDISIQIDKPVLALIDTISMYLNPENQVAWYPYILSTHPRRIIFNPGSENPELMRLAEAHGIQTDASCTLVLLSTGQF